MDAHIKELLSNVEQDFHKRLQDVESKIRAQMDELDKQKQLVLQLQEEQKQILQISQKLNTPIMPLYNKVKLNVGGITFTTHLETLVLEKPTYFSAMFSEHFNIKPDADGMMEKNIY